jgi:NDP-sugar pyrophosphorylase family protein
MKLADPAMYGRIVRDASGAVTRIVEAKDASDEEKRIDEVNAGIYVFEGGHLFDNLRNLSPENAQKEYYLTDLLAVVRDGGHRVGAVVVDDPVEALGVNSRGELAQVENEIQRRVVIKLMSEGVTFRNPSTVVIDSTVTIGADTVVYPFVTLEGNTRIGEACVIEPGVHLVNVTVGDDVHLKTGTVAEEAIIEDEATVGPYAHLRPGTQLGRKVKVGNFVETKKATFGEGAKASHLSYIGDAEDRRRREHRRRHDHVQLRRQEQAQDDHRRRRLHRLRLATRRAGAHRQRRVCRRRLDDHERRASRFARAQQNAATRRRRLGKSEEGVGERRRLGGWPGGVLAAAPGSYARSATNGANAA